MSTRQLRQVGGYWAWRFYFGSSAHRLAWGCRTA